MYASGGVEIMTVRRFSIDFLIFSLVFHWFSTKTRQIVGVKKFSWASVTFESVEAAKKAVDESDEHHVDVKWANKAQVSGSTGGMAVVMQKKGQRTRTKTMEALAMTALAATAGSMNETAMNETAMNETAMNETEAVGEENAENAEEDLELGSIAVV